MRLLRGRGLSRRVRCLVVAASLRRLAGLWFSWYQLYLRFLFAWNMGAPLHRAESDSDDRCRACGCAYFKLGLRCFRSSVPWTQLLRVSSFLYVYICLYIYIYICTFHAGSQSRACSTWGVVPAFSHFLGGGRARLPSLHVVYIIYYNRIRFITNE